MTIDLLAFGIVADSTAPDQLNRHRPGHYGSASRATRTHRSEIGRSSLIAGIPARSRFVAGRVAARLAAPVGISIPASQACCPAAAC